MTLPDGSSDTIAAIATPPGVGGIAVLRLSGPGVPGILRRLFVPMTASQGLSAAPLSGPTSPEGPCVWDGSASAEPSQTLFSFQPRHMHYGRALDSEGRPLDEVLAVYMPGPHSATGEDVGEIHCHGGTGIATALLEACLQCGARLAGGGEFTRRAFLNGRIDLTQAEAVAEIITAPTREGIRLAQAKLDGLMSGRVSHIRQAVDALRVQIALAVDFPDEEAELLPKEAFAAALETARAEISALLAGFERARLWREGATVVLAGRVNAGKSSLLNALLGRRRAIVSAEPGTTRDYIEETVNLAGMAVRLIDTAGLRESGDLVEEEGIRFSRELAQEADCLLLVVDGNVGLAGEDWEFLVAHEKAVRRGAVLLVMNKVDREEPAGRGEAESSLDPSGRYKDLRVLCPYFAVSAKYGHGLEALGKGIRAAVSGGISGGASSAAGGGDVAPNLRQAGLLKAALKELDALFSDLHADLPPDILSVRLDAAAEFLDEVTGTSSSEELLDRIFASFCIGK